MPLKINAENFDLTRVGIVHVDLITWEKSGTNQP